MSSIRNTQQVEEKSRALLYPLIIVMSIIPLIVHQKQTESHLTQYDWFTNETTINDFFLYYKEVWLVIMGIVMLLVLVWKIKNNKQYQTLPKVLIPAAVYGVCVILSMIFSIDPMRSLRGSMDQFESGLVLLGYVIFMYYAYLLVEDEFDLEFLIKAWLVSMGVLCVIGLLQVLGHDFFATNFGKRLITMKEYWDHLDAISFAFGKNRIYLTLYNPNYVGVYASLAIPILVTLLLFTKKMIMRAIYAVLIVGMVICIVGSQSKTAFLTLAVVALFAIVLFRKPLFRYWFIVVPGIVVLTIVFFVFDASIGHSYTNSIKSALQTFKADPPTYAVTRVDTLDDEVVITYNNQPLHLSYTNQDGQFAIVVKDDTGNQLQTTTSENAIVIQDERFAGIQLTPVSLDNIYGIQISGGGIPTWCFSNEVKEGDSSYYFLTPFGKWDKVNNPEFVKMNERFFSGRGYIWSRTIPLLKKYALVGSGPDTYVLAFPQDDYVGLENNGYKGSLVTKPHNLYLQIAVQTGLISLLAFLALYGIYFVQSIRIYIRSGFDSYFAQVGAGIFLGTIGYMIAGITNDSTTGVAPIFWILLGLGFAINKKLKIEKTV